MARRYPLLIYQGKTLTKPFRRRIATGPNAGQVFDPFAYEVTDGWLQVRDKPAFEGGVVLFELTVANGGITLGRYDDGTGKEWSGYLYADAEATRSLQPWGVGGYELVLATADRSWVKPLFTGPALLVPAVTVLPPYEPEED
jgi:hypothetical protein